MQWRRFMIETAGGGGGGWTMDGAPGAMHILRKKQGKS